MKFPTIVPFYSRIKLLDMLTWVYFSLRKITWCGQLCANLNYHSTCFFKAQTKSPGESCSLQWRRLSTRGQLVTRKQLRLTFSGGRFPPSNEMARYFGRDQSRVAVDGPSVKTLFCDEEEEEGGGRCWAKTWGQMQCTGQRSSSPGSKVSCTVCVCLCVCS